MGKKNIITLRGGLGNQFYQLAALNYFIEKVNNTNNNYIDTSNFNLRKNSREVEIDSLYKFFNIDFDYFFSNNYKYSIFEKLNEKIPNFEFFSNYIFLKDSDDIKKVISSNSAKNKKIIFAGYFQKHEIAIKSPLARLDNNKSNDENYLGIHIRFGDYLAEPFNKIYWKFNVKYLKDSLKKVFENYKENEIKKIYIFTDSPNETKDILKRINIQFLNNCEFIRTGSNIKDLILLSKCNIKILSNSTYSLVSYYIGKNSLTIFPKKWFLHKPTDPEIYPPNNYKGKVWII